MIRQQLKKTGLCLLMAAELFFLIWTGYRDLGASFSTVVQGEDVLLKAPAPKGIYRVCGRVRVSTVAKEGVSSCLRITCPENPYALDAEEVWLEDGYQELDYLFYTHDRDLKLQILTDVGKKDSVTTEDLTLTYLPLRSLGYHLMCLGALFVLLDLVLYGLLFQREKLGSLFRQNGSRILFDACILCIALLPLCTGDLLTNGGQDHGFHMMRIRGIADGIQSGMFPVKIMPGVLWGHGYALGVYYGDLFLYPFAFIYLFGCKLRNAYKLYILCVTVLSYIIAKRCFRGICDLLGFRGARFGIPASSLVAAVYLLGIYRLSDVYTRGAVGEFTALMFFPMILYGLYAVYEPERPGGRRLLAETARGWLWLGLGLSGVIWSHVLSTLLLTEFGILFLLLNLKSTFRKKVLAGLGKAFVLAVLSCAGFLIPFLDAYLHLDIWAKGSSDLYVSGVRVALPQLFSFTCNPVGEAVWGGMREEMNQGVGFAMGVVFAGVIVCLEMGVYGKRKGAVVRIFILTLVSMFLASDLFPAWWCYSHLPEVYRVWSKVQFGFRYLEIAEILLTALFMETVAALSGRKQAEVSGVSETSETSEIWISKAGFYLAAAVFALTLFQGILFQESYMQKATPEKALNIFRYTWGYEYMPEGSSPENLRYHREIYPSDGRINWNLLSEKGLSMDLQVQAPEEGGYLLLPRIYYPGYEAVVTQAFEDLPAGGETKAEPKERSLETVAGIGAASEENSKDSTPVTAGPGDTGMLKVMFPPGFSGEIRVDFRKPILWRVGEGISLLSLLTVAFWITMEKRRSKCDKILQETKGLC